jgi:pyridinium-3,5-biscarboxylic acid mononucleotide synthase
MLDNIRKLLEGVRDGSVSVVDALSSLRKLPFEDIGFARVDHHRNIRGGFPEVIYCEGKTIDQITGIFKKLLESGCANIMATRAGSAIYEAVSATVPDAVYYEQARIVVANRQPGLTNPGFILVVTAGTSDIPVAEEAAVTAEIMGNSVRRLYDVGVAGIHRLFANSGDIMDANVIVVAAGMDGALASVVGGLVDKPVIAVPTSVGYGASFGGLAALLTMINSCASGVGTVNIDNGFGAGYLASLVNSLAKSQQQHGGCNDLKETGGG